jgi:hypothetical protein
MIAKGTSLATLAPPLAPPVVPKAPQLPPPPAGLSDGSAALGPLPPAPWGVRQLPRKFLMAGMMPLGVAAALTVVSLFVDWPGSVEAKSAQAVLMTKATAQSGQPVWYRAPGVTPPEPLTPWPRVRSVVGYPNHTADVTVRFLVGTDGKVDRTGLTVTGRGSGPVSGVTAALYSKMQFRPGRIGRDVVPVVMERKFRFPE